MADRDFPHLGFDPAPGDVHETRQLSRALGRLADELGTTVTELERLDGGQWKGKAATAFTDHVAEDVAPDMKRAHTSFDKAATALRRWAVDLERFQVEAAGLEREARRKKEALGEARRLVAAGAATPYLDAPATGGAAEEREAEREKKQQEKREAAAEAAGDELEAVRKRAKELRERYFQAADATGRHLDTAADIAPDEPGLFDRIASGVSDVLGDTLDWVKDHADLIKAIGDVLSYVTAALAVLAIVTAPFGIGAAFATAALITGGLTLATHGIAKAAGADVSWATIGLDVLGVLPVAGAFSKGAKLANLGAARTRAGQLGANYVANPHRARNFASFGDAAGKVTGGLKISPFGKNVALWGRKKVGLVEYAGSGLRSRMAGVAHKGYGEGQWLGTRGLSLISGKHVAIDPFSAGGRMLDSGIKMAPKLVTLPQHVGMDVNIGDRFEAAFGR
ncbi:enoyl-CoA hydratase/isomerase family protein [Streptomyces sp. WMMC500]|uniref:putative T7SS-secreted protein n=1 Tax=Streptomyces sp. WMMC500 TaxID=3015154 RepID=UPI00248CFBF2|nr:enoyl-CoA hydratase/isomerase family protein [Streptomyces sp. WMMC500]WBB64203.1 enoyl-CoA hydratase/isomerase family protein [Streptomyces sp. WMMC500]